jgi:hypothetical protein
MKDKFATTFFENSDNVIDKNLNKIIEKQSFTKFEQGK